MTEEDNKSIEEIEAEYRALMSSKIEVLKAEQQARDAAKAEETFNAAVDVGVEKKLLAEKEALKLAEDKKREDELASVNANETGNPLETGNEIKGVMSKFTNPETEKHYKQMGRYLKNEGLDIKDLQPYSEADIGASQLDFAFTDSDTGCEDNVSAWSPDDVYCNGIWYAAQCESVLAGKVTVRACDIRAGDGLSVQIRTITADTFPSALNPCECATCISNTFATHTLTLARYDLFKIMCNLDEFDVGSILPTAMIETMSRSFAIGVDGLIYTALTGATPTYTETLASDAVCDPSRGSDGACCAYATELYTSIIQLEADMRAAGYGRKGFVLLLHPTIALYLKYKEGVNPPPWVNNITMNGNEISKIGKINVIEYCGANDCSDVSTGDVVGVLFDPTRAVGEAYGKRPHLKKDEDPIECDSWKFVYRMYIAVAALDQASIGHILQP